MGKNLRWWAAALVVIGYWAINLLGVYPAAILFRLLAFIVPEAYRAGDILVSIESYAAVAYAATVFMMKVTREEHPVFCMVNSIVASVVYAAYALSFVFSLSSVVSVAGLLAGGAATVVYIVFAVAFYRDSVS